MLQILDDGRVTDAQGHNGGLSKNAIIINDQQHRLPVQFWIFPVRRQ